LAVSVGKGFPVASGVGVAGSAVVAADVSVVVTAVGAEFSDFAAGIDSGLASVGDGFSAVCWGADSAQPIVRQRHPAEIQAGIE